MALICQRAVTLHAQSQQTPHAVTVSYGQLKSFPLTHGSARAENLVLTRDRAVITFTTGAFYFPPPVEGEIRGAVFVGSGTFRAAVPPSDFERDNVRRLLKADEVASDFKTAVLRFTDDTFGVIGKGLQSGPAPPDAVKLAAEFESRFLEETGANVSARQLVSILNKEAPGFFFAQFDKGQRGRFTFLLDYQARIPVTNFRINGGERGLIFAFDRDIGDNDVWMAFYALEDYQRGRVSYSDAFDLVDTPHCSLQVDLRDPKKHLAMTARLDLVSRAPNLRVFPFALGEDLSWYDAERRKKQLHVGAARLVGAGPVQVFQETWEGGLTVILPTPVALGQKFSLELDLAGEFMYQSQSFPELSFPRRTTTWFPRHGYLARSTYDVTLRHHKNRNVVTVGTIVRDEAASDAKDEMLTEFRLDEPVALLTFAVGPYQIHKETVKMETGGSLPLEFYSMPGSLAAIKEDFILAELNNCVRYFSALFGKYPYPVFRATFHPFGFGQGFPTMLMIPATDRATKRTYAFIAHETSHQWWGDVVLWRSYRDQWLSEGFAEYSGLLYTRLRDGRGPEKELLDELRYELKAPPHTLTGLGKGRLVDVGPLILGHRLSTRETGGAYTALIYNKGALVLRMLHFLFSDPQNGNDKDFFDMMSDFVRRHQNGWASTDTFFAVANEHVARTPLARKFGYKDLGWFYRQWVLQTYLPTYRLNYTLEAQPDGSTLVKGMVFQDGVPEDEQWFMPLPLVLRFGKGQEARGTVYANGPRTPVNIKVPMRPDKVELDPDLWILSEKTSTEKHGN